MIEEVDSVPPSRDTISEWLEEQRREIRDCNEERERILKNIEELSSRCEYLLEQIKLRRLIIGMLEKESN